MNADQLNHYKSKLGFEMDSFDVHEALGNGEPIVVVDGRSAEAYAAEHIPVALSRGKLVLQRNEEHGARIHDSNTLI